MNTTNSDITNQSGSLIHRNLKDADTMKKALAESSVPLIVALKISNFQKNKGNIITKNTRETFQATSCFTILDKLKSKIITQENPKLDNFNDKLTILITNAFNRSVYKDSTIPVDLQIAMNALKFDNPNIQLEEEFKLLNKYAP